MAASSQNPRASSKPAPNAARAIGRPRGSIDRVLQGREFGLDEFVAVKSFLYGVDPLSAVKRYLIHGETSESTDTALRKLGQLMHKIAARGATRQHGPGVNQNNVNSRAADAIDKAANACLDAVAKIKTVRATARAVKNADMTIKAVQKGLRYVAKAHLPAPPEQFHNLRAFDDWYEDNYKPDELLEPGELDVQYQDHLASWYESQGIYYEPDYSKAHSQYAEQSPVAATQIEQVTAISYIDAQIRALAAGQIDNLQWTVQRVPQASDHVSAWIGGTTLTALVESDIYTLYTLTSLIQRHGAAWWRQVKSLGPSRAERLKTWLLVVKVEGIEVSEEQFKSIQYRRMVEVKRFREKSPSPPSLKDLQLEPITPYLLNPLLNGSEGIFKQDKANQMKAANDIDAIVTTLNKYKDKKNTLAVYAREICRFCLWAYRVKRLPISSLGIDDARDYREFLGNIPGEWISQVKDSPPRGSSDWRPFRGQLDEVSQRKALTSVNVILRQLMEGGYLTGNPMAGVLKHAELSKSKMDIQRAFSATQWALICELLEKEVPSPTSRRLMALMHLLHATGLRRDELFKSRIGNIEMMRVDGETAHLLNVTGKRGKMRKVLIPCDVMSLVDSHLKDRAKTFIDDVKSKEGRGQVPLISVIGKTVKAFQIGESDHPDPNLVSGIKLEERTPASACGALSPDGMRSLLGRFLIKCTIQAKSRRWDSYELEAFENATLHWMRHSFGHAMADANVDLRVIQKAMGHVNINTTAAYAKSDVEQMVRGVRQGRIQAEKANMLSINEQFMPSLDQ